MKIGQTVYLWNGDLKTKPVKDKVVKITAKTVKLESDKSMFKMSSLIEDKFINKNGLETYGSKSEVNNIIVNRMIVSLEDDLFSRIPGKGLSKFLPKISKAYNLFSEVIESIEKES